MQTGVRKRGQQQQSNRLSDADFQRLVQGARERHNLSDIIGRHTNLKPRGFRELVGLCCFHHERTPSLEVNDAKGTYHCHGCGAGGDAITFLIQAERMTFRTAVEWLLGDALPVISDDERVRRKLEDERDRAERVALAQSIWVRAEPAAGTPAEVYARSRGITMPLPPTVRFVMTPRWRDRGTGECGRDHPAMVCALQDANANIVGVQCVFLMDGGRRKYERVRADGSKAKAKLTFGTIVGSALWLGPLSRHVTICEGPEDGLTLAQQLPGRTIWVACGTALMSQVILPAEVEHVTLAGDNGGPGRLAVDQARAHYLGLGVGVNELFPAPEFKDFNDQLRGIRSDD